MRMQTGDRDAQPGTPTVYVVDDDPAMRASLGWLLESMGLPVRTAANAAEFLRTCPQDARGCLVLNVHMPGMGGLALQEELLRREQHLPILMITGYVDPGEMARAMRRGAFDFVEKPFDDEALLASVRAALRQDDKRRRQRAERAGGGPKGG